MSSIAALLARCHANPAPLSGFEADFLADIEARPRELSPKQIALMERIASRIAPSAIAALLADHAEALATQLKGAPPSLRTRDECRYGTRGSFSVITAGLERGKFFDHEEGVGGDALGMVAHLLRYSAGDAINWAKSWLGIDSIDPASLPPAPPPEVAKAAAPKTTLPLARAIWREAVPAAGTPVEGYLATRGLMLPSGAPLKFHGACPRGEERHPAMIALMTDPATAEPVGVHRTFLQPDGSGKPDGQVKMMLGGHGIIRLSPDDEVTMGLGLAEGIETALSVMQGAGWSPVWACGSAGAISAFPVLPGIECLAVFADADANGAGIKAARTAAARWVEAGREVVVHYPSAGGADWNDVARGVA